MIFRWKPTTFAYSVAVLCGDKAAVLIAVELRQVGVGDAVAVSILCKSRIRSIPATGFSVSSGKQTVVNQILPFPN